MRTAPEELRFTRLREGAATAFAAIEDGRQRGKIRYSVRDCLLSGLAVMYFQEPSLLSFQERMEKQTGNNNLRTLFGVDALPSDTQIRTVIDAIDPDGIRPIFAELFRRLQRSKLLESFRSLDDQYLVLLDGSDYFASEKVHCAGCLTRKHGGGGPLAA